MAANGVDLVAMIDADRRSFRRWLVAMPLVMLVIAGVTIWITLRLADQNSPPPDIWTSGDTFLVATQDDQDQWSQLVDASGVPVVDINVGLPLAVAVCSDVDEAAVAIDRRWEAFNGAERVFDLAQDAGELKSGVKAGQCVARGAVLRIPDRVHEEALDRPGLVWRLRSTATPVEPVGVAHRGTSESFVFAELTGTEEIRDRTADMGEILSDLAETRGVNIDEAPTP